MELIDRSELERDTEWNYYDDDFVSYSQSQIKSAPTVKAVPINKLRNLVDKLQDETLREYMTR